MSRPDFTNEAEVPKGRASRLGLDLEVRWEKKGRTFDGEAELWTDERKDATASGRDQGKPSSIGLGGGVVD